MQLLNQGYLPLALTIGELKASETVFATLLDRILEERDPSATLGWLGVARRIRPLTLKRALNQIRQTEQLRPPEDGAAFLERTQETLGEVMGAYKASEDDFDALYRALRGGQRAQASRIQETLRGKERVATARLRRAARQVQMHISQMSARAAEQERNTLRGVLLLCALALGVGGGLTWWSQRLLAPLPRLRERVAAVARGDLSRRLEKEREDEIGQVTQQFENMVDALAQRDSELRATTEKLVQSERLATIGRMAAHVTHEVRNPLSSIGLNVELLAEEASSWSAQHRKLLSAIQKEIDRLTTITKHYLGLTRLPAPQLQGEDLRKVLGDLVSFVERDMQQRHITVETDFDAALPRVWIDEAQLRQALLNLLRNAREALPDGGNIRLSAHASAPDGVKRRVELRVEDSGPGIDPSVRERLFEPFVTSKPQGSGLGLALTQQIVVAHGGSIRYEDRPEGGGAFVITLPVESATQSQASR